MFQPKLERLLRLMMLLTSNSTNTLAQLADKLNTSERSIYRYIDTFKEAGFVIKKNGNVFRIDKSSPYFKDISQLVHFTEEEAYILKSAIESIDENNLIKQNLKKKLYTVYDYNILAETVVKGKNAFNVNKLVEAIEQKKKVLLRNYSSANSNEVSNRIVEPFNSQPTTYRFGLTKHQHEKTSYSKYRGLQKLTYCPMIGNLKTNIKPGSSMFSA